MAIHELELDDTEIKMLLVAVRQVLHTLTIAESQSAAGGEPLATDYEGVRAAYERLERKLAELAESSDTARPYIVK